MGLAVLLKGPEVRSAGGEHAVAMEVLVHEVVETEVRRRPAAASQTTIEPFFRSVGGILCGTTPTTGGVSEGDDAIDHAAKTASLGGRRLWGRGRWGRRRRGRRRCSGRLRCRRLVTVVGPGSLIGNVIGLARGGRGR